MKTLATAHQNVPFVVRKECFNGKRFISLLLSRKRQMFCELFEPPLRVRENYVFLHALRASAGLSRKSRLLSAFRALA